MQNRDDAIDWLTKRGYHAFARHCALGETIGIAKKLVVGDDGINVFEPTCVVLYSIAQDRWAAMSQKIPGRDVEFSSLEAAVKHALQVLDTYTIA